MSTGQPVVGPHPIFARLDTIMSQNSAAMLWQCRHLLLLSEGKVKWKWHTWIRRKMWQRGKNRAEYRGIHKSRENLDKSPYSPALGDRMLCLLCRQHWWTSKDMVLGMVTQASGSCSHMGHWTKSLNHKRVFRDPEMSPDVEASWMWGQIP